MLTISKSADFESLKLQIIQSSAIANSVSCNQDVDACSSNWKSALLGINHAIIPEAKSQTLKYATLTRKESARCAGKRHNSAFYLTDKN